MGLSTGHLIILLLIVIVIFGTKKLRNIGGDLGAAVKNFKDGMNGGDKPAETAAPATPPAAPTALTPPPASNPTQVIDVESKTKS